MASQAGLSSRIQRALGAALALAITGGGCRSESETGGAGAPSKSAEPAAEPVASAAEPAAAPAGPAAGGAAGADPSLTTGTPQNLSFSGAATGTIKDAGRGTGIPSGCSKSGSSFLFNIEGTLDGKDLYSVAITIAFVYEGPRTYPIGMVKVDQGVSVFVVNRSDKNAMGLLGESGTVTVNADERSGSIDAKLKLMFGKGEGVSLTGTWKCAPDRA